MMTMYSAVIRHKRVTGNITSMTIAIEVRERTRVCLVCVESILIQKRSKKTLSLSFSFPDSL